MLNQVETPEPPSAFLEMLETHTEREAFVSGWTLARKHARTGSVGDWSEDRCGPMERELQELAERFGPFGTRANGWVNRGYEDGYLATMQHDGTVGEYRRSDRDV